MTDQPTTDSTGNAEASPALPALTVKQLAGQKGGRAGKRHVALLGLGVELPAGLDLRTSDARMAVLEATAAAVAQGKTSALVATTLVGIVRESRVEADGNWERLARRQQQLIEELRSGRTVDAG